MTATTAKRPRQPIHRGGVVSRIQKQARNSVCLLARLQQKSNATVRFRFEPSLLSDLGDERIWQNGKVDHSCGFVVYCPFGDISDSELVESIVRRCCKKELVGDCSDSLRVQVYDFLLTSSDRLDQVIESVSKIHSDKGRTHILFGQGDVLWWNAIRERPQYCRILAFFHRLVQPLCVNFVVDETTFVRGSKVSTLDALLNAPDIKEFVVDAILLHVCCLYEVAKKSSVAHAFLEKLLHYLVSRRIGSGQAYNMNAFEDITRFVCKARPELAALLPSFDAPTAVEHPSGGRDMSLYKQKARIWKKYVIDLEGMDRVTKPSLNIGESSKSGNPVTMELYHKFLFQRRLLIEQHAAIRRLQMDNCSKGRSRETNKADKSLQYTDLDFSLDDFVEQTRFMNKVNDSLPRIVISGESRPRLQQIHLPADRIDAIKKLFFDADGSLCDAIKDDIDYSAKHGYINFQHMLSLEDRRDKRWQVPIRKHCLGSRIATRDAIEQMLTGVINPESEDLDDVGILIGGTEDQSLHHDVARQFVSWIPRKYLQSEEAGMATVGGWEIDRLVYNEAMSRPNAPASIVVGMADDNEVLLGIQNDQIVRVGEHFCFIKGGVENECFEILRENNFLAVVRAKTGVMFTGDFPHAGVRNVKVGTRQEQLLTSLNKRVAFARKKFLDDDVLSQTRAIVDVLCRFPNLNEICRLHCSTEMTTFNLSVPSNTIGFYDCLVNPRDRRCLEGDSPMDDEVVASPTVLVAHGNDDENESDDDEEWEDTSSRSRPS